MHKHGTAHFLAPAEQLEVMHKTFMLWHLHMFVVRCLGMKFYGIFPPPGA